MFPFEKCVDNASNFISFKIDVQIISWCILSSPLHRITNLFAFLLRSDGNGTFDLFLTFEDIQANRLVDELSFVISIGRCDWLQRNRSYSECFG